MGRRIDREGPIHRSIVEWLRVVLPSECIVHHCRNEINKRGSAIARELAEAKRKGAVTGFPDLLILPFANGVGACFLEVKAEGNYTDKNQKEVHERLRALGYPVAVVRSIDDAREALIEFGVGFQEAAK
jgi:hypothetical protein